MITISEILDYLDTIHEEYIFKGSKEDILTGFSSIKNYKSDTLTWLKNKAFLPSESLSAEIKAIITKQSDDDSLFRNVIMVNNPKRTFFNVVEHFFSFDNIRPKTGHYTYISPDVTIGKDVTIGHNCVIDGEIEIGDGTVIWNNVTIINRVQIGENCEIQSGTVIGHDGFAYTEDENNHKDMIKHYGGVIIGNNVRIGMNNVIARGLIDNTVIGNGVKIADLSHIGHNNIIEDDVTIINSAIYGSCHIGKNAYLSYCSVRNQTEIGENAVVGMASNVVKDVPGNVTVIGNPARIYKK